MTHGQFAFTTHEAGNYLACFWVDGHNQGGGDVSVNIDWKTGIAAKDWDSVARKEKIEVSLSSYFSSLTILFGNDAITYGTTFRNFYFVLALCYLILIVYARNHAL